MKRFEYKMEKSDSAFLKEASLLGKEGWELVSVVLRSWVDKDAYFFYFKKEINVL